MLKEKIKNYRYNFICENCGKFIKKNDKHENCKPKIKTNLFLCGGCKKYKPYNSFGRDKSKKYGIRYDCKDCRKKAGNGNKKIKIRKLIEKIKKL